MNNHKNGLSRRGTTANLWLHFHFGTTRLLTNLLPTILALKQKNMLLKKKDTPIKTSRTIPALVLCPCADPLSSRDQSPGSVNFDSSRIGLFNSGHDVAKKTRGCHVAVDMSLVISRIRSLLFQFYLFELRRRCWGMHRRGLTGRCRHRSWNQTSFSAEDVAGRVRVGRGPLIFLSCAK